MEWNDNIDPSQWDNNDSSDSDTPDTVWHVSTFDPKTLQPLPAPQALKGLAQAIASHLRELEAEVDSSGPVYSVLELMQSRFTLLMEHISAQPKLLTNPERRKVDDLFKDHHDCLSEMQQLDPGLESQIQDLQNKMLLCKELFRDTEAEWSLM